MALGAITLTAVSVSESSWQDFWEEHELGKHPGNPKAKTTSMLWWKRVGNNSF